MRDPDRIDGVLAAVKSVWVKYPDLRLGQLLWAIASGDPFFMEDDELVKRSGSWELNNTKPPLFDAAEFLDSPSRIAHYLKEALETGNNETITDALRVVVRAMEMKGR